MIQKTWLLDSQANESIHVQSLDTVSLKAVCECGFLKCILPLLILVLRLDQKFQMVILYLGGSDTSPYFGWMFLSVEPLHVLELRLLVLYCTALPAGQSCEDVKLQFTNACMWGVLPRRLFGFLFCIQLFCLWKTTRWMSISHHVNVSQFKLAQTVSFFSTPYSPCNISVNHWQLGCSDSHIPKLTMWHV